MWEILHFYVIFPIFLCLLNGQARTPVPTSNKLRLSTYTRTPSGNPKPKVSAQFLLSRSLFPIPLIIKTGTVK